MFPLEIPTDLTYNKYRLTDIPDVVGYNLYFGWHYGNTDDLTKFLDEEHGRV
ncbi:hypothetical protein FACS1894159_11940 [Bacteroidia bacterium]|nr:hypothetical protein FACS1894159_11940 [Bacteroidia bacterium]